QQSLSGEIFSLTNSTFNLRSPSQLSSALFPNSPKQSVTMEKIDSLTGDRGGGKNCSSSSNSNSSNNTQQQQQQHLW
ncbi:hypothetical protein ScalyP_jg883, partial [Parmales sp. scaly parma]